MRIGWSFLKPLAALHPRPQSVNLKHVNEGKSKKQECTRFVLATEHKQSVIGEYRTLVERALATLSPARHDVAVALADLPDMIRGYEDIKVDNVRQFRARAAELAARLG